MSASQQAAASHVCLVVFGGEDASTLDGDGSPTNVPEPRLRLADGSELPYERVADGRYRAHVPAGTPGATDAQVEAFDSKVRRGVQGQLDRLKAERFERR